jgi:DNA-binding MarR family transcriptional regulator
MTPDGPLPTKLPPGVVLQPMAPRRGGDEGASQPFEKAPGGPMVGGRQLVRSHRQANQKQPQPSRKTSHRFETINQFVDATMRSVTPRAAQTWLVLWRDTKPDGTARAGVTDIARRAGCSTSTTKRALAELRRRGLIRVLERGRKDGSASLYRVSGSHPDSNEPGGLKTGTD